MWTSLANLVYGLALLFVMSGADSVLHPDSPIFNSEARDIQVYFVTLLVLLTAAGWFLARGWYRRNSQSKIGSQ